MVKRTLAAAAVLAAFALPGTAHGAIVKTGPSSYVAVPKTANAWTTIAGYQFRDMPYYNPSAAVDSAVEVWWELLKDPNYADLPPVTSGSVELEVGGTVEDEDEGSTRF